MRPTVLAASLAIACCAAAGARRGPGRLRVAVVARQPDQWADRGLARGVASLLARLERVWPANAAVARRLVPVAKGATAADVAEAGRLLECSFVAILATKGRGEAEAELVAVPSGSVQRLSCQGSLHELPGLAALALAGAMGAASAQGELARLAEPLAATDAAIEALWRGDAASGPKEQIRLYRQGLESDPESALLHNQLGAALARSGQLAGAIAEFDRAIELAPDYAAPRTNRGLVLKRQKRWQEAEKSLRAAIALGAKSPTPHIALARLLDRVGDTIEAVDQLELAVDADPCHADALMTLAGFYFECYNLRDAMRTARRLLEIQPDHVPALNLVGLMLLVPREYQKAEAVFLRALTAMPDDPETLSNLALAVYGQGNSDMAIGILQRVIARNPGYANAHLYLGRIYLAEKQADEAADELQRAAELKPRMAAARSGLESARSAAAASRRPGCGCLGIESPLNQVFAASDLAGPLLPVALVLAPHLVRLVRRRRRR